MIKLFKKPESLFLLCLFQQIWTLIFVYFWPHAESPQKKKKKKLIQISGERRAERWPDRQETDILAKNHTRGRSSKPSSMNYFFEFWVRVLNQRPRMYMLCYDIQYLFFHLLFGWIMTNVAPLARAQLHSPDFNHYVFIIILSKGQWLSHNYESFKTWDGLHTDAQIQRLTYRQTDRHKKVNI